MHPWDGVCFILVSYPFDIPWSSVGLKFTEFFFGNFTLMFTRDIDLYFFSCSVSVWFNTTFILASLNKLGGIPSFKFHGKVYVELLLRSYVFGKIHQ